MEWDIAIHISKEFTCNDLATSCKNLPKFGTVTPEFKRVKGRHPPSWQAVWLRCLAEPLLDLKRVNTQFCGAISIQMCFTHLLGGVTAMPHIWYTNHQNRSNGYWDTVIYKFFEMAVVCRLRFVGCILASSLKSIWWTLSIIVQNLVGITSVVLIIWKFKYFAHLAWKCLFMPQKRVAISTQPPKAHHCVETHHMIFRLSISIH